MYIDKLSPIKPTYFDEITSIKFETPLFGLI